MLGGKAASCTVALLLACVPVLAGRAYEPYQSNRDYRGSQNQQARRPNQNFYSGVRQGGHGGQYYDQRHANDGYDQRYNKQRGGIGPGKGALIGGAGGAVLGAVVGGGLKGSLVGGAAGAGIGAVVGEAAQSRRH